MRPAAEVADAGAKRGHSVTVLVHAKGALPDAYVGTKCGLHVFQTIDE